ncbi:MAG TPA: LysR family transcriptional regulator [Gemmataceae bacterium]|jgi:LysR family hydrogen peroxide-inducible transcriptional activator|nr:LysR family transcriptional regulator [Gemmataceae bacterium]
MELHQLRYFAAVADLGSFTKAARRCLVAQPSLSQQIIKLEKELGQPLFERLGHTVRLTDAGLMLHDQAVAILASVEEAKNRVSEAHQEGGTITVGAIPTVAPYFLPPLICEFKRTAPEASVVIHEDLTEHTVEHCLRGELDVGVLALPVADQRLHVEKLLEEELLLALPAKHHLVKKRQVSVDDLNGEPFILLSEMHCLGQQILAFCNRKACRPFVTCHSSQVLTVQELVSIGHGVSLLPTMACALDRHPHRRYRRLSGEAPARTLALVWHKQRYQRPIVRRFIEFVKVRTAENCR